ncbi:amidohydrolase [Sinosporangium siamense]|uniref:Amidohydrolase n=1 Tax=Sinosporangium siamense TaxID=1367973 RepID=A0A919RFF9_9ACTN|nr:amidohydrolase [Sinosporangium siamense]GII92908.1 amidohydrolase [Sinosporangium siamense]
MKKPDLVILNGTIETLVPGIGQVEALAIRDGRVVGHGRQAAAAADRSNVLDLGGSFAMPGLIDIHNHHGLAGFSELFEITLPRGSSLNQILALIADRASTAGPDDWIVGGCWESNLMPSLDSTASLRLLDEASRGRPVLLRDDTLHNRWANSRAMRLAGIDQYSRDPVGGVVRRNDTGDPNGVLLESAGLLVERSMTRLRTQANDANKQASRHAIQTLNSFGITAFQDAATSLAQMQALKELDDAGELDAWVVSSMLCNDFIFGHEPLGEGIIRERHATASEHHRPTFIKLFLDGVPASRTAAFLEPYLPDRVHGSCFCGQTTMDGPELEAWLLSTAGRGISAKVHCTGDATVRMFLDAVEKVRGAGHHDVIYHLAHGQLIDHEDIPRLAELRVVADASPPLWYPTAISEATNEVLPNNRAMFMAPNRTILDSGAVLTGGSDWPVCDEPNVWNAVYGLITRRDPKKLIDGELWAEQAITRAEAVAAYTTASADAMGLGDLIGRLGTDYSADFIVMSDDPFMIDVEKLPQVEIMQTWFNGRLVFER